MWKRQRGFASWLAAVADDHAFFSSSSDKEVPPMFWWHEGHLIWFGNHVLMHSQSNTSPYGSLRISERVFLYPDVSIFIYPLLKKSNLWYNCTDVVVIHSRILVLIGDAHTSGIGRRIMTWWSAWFPSWKWQDRCGVDAASVCVVLSRLLPQWWVLLGWLSFFLLVRLIRIIRNGRWGVIGWCRRRWWLVVLLWLLIFYVRFCIFPVLAVNMGSVYLA